MTDTGQVISPRRARSFRGLARRRGRRDMSLRLGVLRG